MIDRPDPAGRAGPSEDRAAPLVAPPSGGPPLLVIFAGCLLLGIGLFAILERQRAHREPSAVPATRAEASTLAPSAPPLEIPPPLPPPPPPPPAEPVVKYVERSSPQPPVIQYVDRPIAAPPPMAVAQSPSARSPEPALVIDLTGQNGQGQKQDESAAHAVVLHHHATVVPQGTIIPAVLETPIDSSGPGPVRAITSTDTRGFDGSRVLIPRGSRLYGEYTSAAQVGQSRVLVTWTNLVRPDGVSIGLNSPSSDARGGAGIPGMVNNHVLARLSSAVLQSALAIGVNVASRPGNNSVIVGAPVQTVGAAGASLIPQADARPIITVKEGADIAVFVAHNLDFSGALPAQ